MQTLMTYLLAKATFFPLYNASTPKTTANVKHTTTETITPVELVTVGTTHPNPDPIGLNTYPVMHANKVQIRCKMRC